MVEILCPHCDEEIELDDDASGVFACPYCDEEFEWKADPAPSKSGGKVTSNSTFKPMKVEYEFKPSFTLMTAHLGPSESIKVEPGAMVAQSSDLRVSTGRAFSGGIAKGLFKAVMGGESFFLNTYTAGNSGGWISLAPSVPGDIGTFDLAPGENLFLQGGAFMACSPNVKTDTKFQGAKSLISGEGVFFLRAFSQSGSGQVFYNAYGAIKEIEVTPDTPIKVDNGHIIAFTEGVSYRVATEGGGAKNLLFGGEGLILQFSGTGKVWIQSRNLWALAASAPFMAR